MLNFTQNGLVRFMDKKTLLYFLFGFFLATMIFARPAHAVDVDTKWRCGETMEIRNSLIRNGEQFIISGAIPGNQSDKGFLMSLWANQQTGTWTILATVIEKNDVSCVVSFGTNFTELKTQPFI